MALANWFPQRELVPIPRTQDGGYSFFDGGLILWDLPGENGGSYTSKQQFSATNKYTNQVGTGLMEETSHYHIYQTETFDVKSGTLCYYVDGKEGKLVAGQKKTIPPYHCHTFWNDASTGEDLVVHITVSGTEKGSKHSGFDDLVAPFIRNFYGYLSSCVTRGVAPVPFQMLRMLDDAEVVLANVPWPAGQLLNWVLGRAIGKWVAGYPARIKLFTEDAE